MEAIETFYLNISVEYLNISIKQTSIIFVSNNIHNIVKILQWFKCNTLNSNDNND